MMFSVQARAILNGQPKAYKFIDSIRVCDSGRTVMIGRVDGTIKTVLNKADWDKISIRLGFQRYKGKTIDNDKVYCRVAPTTKPKQHPHGGWTGWGQRR